MQLALRSAAEGREGFINFLKNNQKKKSKPDVDFRIAPSNCAKLIYYSMPCRGWKPIVVAICFTRS
jgi:hypothetical protein